MIVTQFRKYSKLHGIYCIFNKLDGKRYIGSTKDLYYRLQSHISALRHDRHHNRHLQFAWNKYGEDNFDILIIEIVNNIDDLINVEQIYIDALSCCDDRFGYNLVPKADRSELSELSKQKLREANYNRVFTDEMREKLSIAQKNRIRSQEEIQAHKELMIKRWQNEEWRKKMSEKVPHNKITKEIELKVIDLYQTTDLTFDQIGKICGMSRPTVRRILKSNDIPFRGHVCRLGSKHHGWKGGIKNCSGCGKKLSAFKTKMCKPCFDKSVKSK